MKIRTKTELLDKLSQEKSWRVKEIAALKALALQNAQPESRKAALRRAGHALLYAHWEGYVKVIGSSYLEYVAAQKLKVKELQKNFLALIIKNRVWGAASSNKFSTLQDTINFLQTQQDAPAKLPFKNIVSTGSNLSSEVLKEISWCLGLDYSQFSAKENWIDYKLLGRRNHIAHGQDMVVDESEFIEVAEEVVALINIFDNQIWNCAVLSSYKI